MARFPIQGSGGGATPGPPQVPGVDYALTAVLRDDFSDADMDGRRDFPELRDKFMLHDDMFYHAPGDINSGFLGKYFVLNPTLLSIDRPQSLVQNGQVLLALDSLLAGGGAMLATVSDPTSDNGGFFNGDHTFTRALISCSLSGSTVANRVDLIGLFDAFPATVGATTASLAEAPISNGAWFRYDANVGGDNWACVVESGGVQIVVSTDFELQLNKPWDLEIIGRNGLWVFKINGIEVAKIIGSVAGTRLFLGNYLSASIAGGEPHQLLDCWHWTGDRIDGI